MTLEQEGSQTNSKKEDWLENLSSRQVLGYGLVLYVVIGVIAFLILLFVIRPEDVEGRHYLAQDWGLAMAGVAGALGIFFTWRSQRLAREGYEQTQQDTQKQLELTRTQLQISQEQQITERFTQAIGQLGATDDKGNPRLEIRLGGIYALERIAKDSAEDYGPVMEVLTAYVRKNTPLPPESSAEGTELSKLSPYGITEALTTKPSADVQAILDVIGRRTEDDIPKEARVRLRDPRPVDLQSTNLQNAWLHGAYLVRALLMRSRLYSATLILANLEGAKLGEADLGGADLRGADLRGADLRGANLFTTRLEEADLRGADLRGGLEFNSESMTLEEKPSPLTERQLEKAFGDKNTKLPEGLKPPSAWSLSIDAQRKEA